MPSSIYTSSRSRTELSSARSNPIPVAHPEYEEEQSDSFSEDDYEDSLASKESNDNQDTRDMLDKSEDEESESESISEDNMVSVELESEESDEPGSMGSSDAEQEVSLEQADEQMGEDEDLAVDELVSTEDDDAEQAMSPQEADETDFDDSKLISKVIWPPNHKYHQFELIDLLGKNDLETCEINSISMEERRRDGEILQDFEANAYNILNRTQFEVKATRSGNSEGRIYTVSVSCKDGSIDVASQVHLLVPHSKR